MMIIVQLMCKALCINAICTSFFAKNYCTSSNLVMTSIIIYLWIDLWDDKTMLWSMNWTWSIIQLTTTDHSNHTVETLQSHISIFENALQNHTSNLAKSTVKPKWARSNNWWLKLTLHKTTFSYFWKIHFYILT